MSERFPKQSAEEIGGGANNFSEVPKIENLVENDNQGEVEKKIYEQGLYDAQKRLRIERIKNLHDQYHPEVIVMTQTSSILIGYGLK